MQQVYGVYAALVRAARRTGGLRFRPASSGVVLSVVNLTNEKQHTYLQFPNLPFTYDDTGRRLFFGFKLKM